MIVIGDMEKGCQSFIFRSEKDLQMLIDNLENLKEYKKLPGESYPGVYAVFPDSVPEKECKNYVAKLKIITT